MGGHAQRPWTPTKRRGPIGAEFRSPGPASVNIPSYVGSKHLLSGKSNSPSYSFGNRPDDKNNSIGPGPGQYHVGGLSNKGKDVPPSLTLLGRPKDPKQFQTPAPGAYNPERVIILMDSAPKYSFGTKGNDAKPNNVPAPNSYNIPSVLGQSMEAGMQSAPAYSLAGKGKDFSRSMSPGPGAYETAKPEAYKNKSPSYSLRDRTTLPSDDTKKPGPGAHSPEKSQLDNPPNYSFGIRHSEYVGALKGIYW